MPRYHHYIWRAKGDVQPNRLVFVDCDTVYEPREHGSAVEAGRAAAWASAGWQGKVGAGERWYCSDGRDVSALWQEVAWLARRPGQSWIVSYRASLVWGALGIWERIEDRRVLLGGGDNGAGDEAAGSAGMYGTSGRANRGGVRRSGVDTPMVQALQHGHSAGRGQDVGAPVGRERSPGGIILEDPPTVIVCRVPGCEGTLIICDLRNWGIDEWPRALSVQDRARWGAKVMHRMITVLQVHQLGSLKTTAGSQAMYTWRRRYYTHAVYCHTNAEALELEDAAYYGGRCECRRLGKIEGEVYHLDFRSLYPSICAVANLPALLVSASDGEITLVPLVRVADVGVIADVTVSTDEPAYPLRRRGDIIYPIGTFRTALAGPELADAVERGRVTAVHRVATYKVSPCLTAFMRNWWDLLCGARSTKDRALEQWIKRVMVCLPGKFGQRGWHWDSAPGACPPGPWSSWWESNQDGTFVRCRSIGWNAQREVRDTWAMDACPAIAAWVTSAGRMRLLEAIRCAGWSEVYYHDTDSLLVSAQGYQSLLRGGHVHEGTLGRLRLLGRHDGADLYGIKHYSIGGQVICAGMPKGDHDPGPDPAHYWYRRWLKSAVQDGHRPAVERVLREYQRAGAYRHGVVCADGRVEPWRIEQ